MASRLPLNYAAELHKLCALHVEAERLLGRSDQQLSAARLADQPNHLSVVVGSYGLRADLLRTVRGLKLIDELTESTPSDTAPVTTKRSLPVTDTPHASSHASTPSTTEQNAKQQPDQCILISRVPATHLTVASCGAGHATQRDRTRAPPAWWSYPTPTQKDGVGRGARTPADPLAHCQE